MYILARFTNSNQKAINPDHIELPKHSMRYQKFISDIIHLLQKLKLGFLIYASLDTEW